MQTFHLLLCFVRKVLVDFTGILQFSGIDK